MQPGGWLFMLTSVGAVLTLASWCFWRVLRPRARPPAGGAPPREG